MKRIKKGVTGAVLLALLTALLVVPASADHVQSGPPTTTLNVQPQGLHDNPTCDDVTTPSDAFLFEKKIEPVEDGTFPLASGDLSGSVTVDAYNTPEGQAFDFDFAGDFVAATVVVKGGPNANLYDYLGAHAPGADADTFLHAPVNPNNGKFYGLSHISFCVAEAGAAIAIEKTAVDDEITVGERAAFDITVSSLGPATAKDVTISDPLPNGVLDWEIVSQTTAGACEITDDTLSCNNIGDLEKDATFTVGVQTTEAILRGSELCGETLDNTAIADGANVDAVQDDASIAVACGSILVHKVDDDGALLAGASFTVSSEALEDPIAMDEVADGVFCLDGLQLDVAYTVTETDAPEGYAGEEDPQTVTPAVDSNCDDRLAAGDNPDLAFENQQLHKVIVIVCHQADETLAESAVTNGDATLQTLPEGHDLEETLCALDGFDDKPHGEKALTVDVGSNAH